MAVTLCVCLCSLSSLRPSAEVEGQRLQGLIEGNKRWLEAQRKNRSMYPYRAWCLLFLKENVLLISEEHQVVWGVEIVGAQRIITNCLLWTRTYLSVFLMQWMSCSVSHAVFLNITHSPLFPNLRSASSSGGLVQLSLDDNNQIKVHHYWSSSNIHTCRRFWSSSCVSQDSWRSEITSGYINCKEVCLHFHLYSCVQISFVQYFCKQLN